MQESITRKLIETKYPKLDIEYHYEDRILYGSFTINGIVCKITVTNRTWDEIWRFIDSISNINKGDSECNICAQSYNKTALHCTKCQHPVCLNCYIKIFRMNDGISKCAYCRHERGVKLSKKNLECVVDDMIRYFESR